MQCASQFDCIFSIKFLQLPDATLCCQMERVSALTEMFLTVNYFQRQGCLQTQLLPSLRTRGCATSTTFASMCTVKNLLGEVVSKAPPVDCFLFFTQ